MHLQESVRCIWNPSTCCAPARASPRRGRERIHGLFQALGQPRDRPLREGGYLTVEDGGWLHLTELGFAAGRENLRAAPRPDALADAHRREPGRWREDACGIEHVISDESISSH